MFLLPILDPAILKQRCMQAYALPRALQQDPYLPLPAADNPVYPQLLAESIQFMSSMVLYSSFQLNTQIDAGSVGTFLTTRPNVRGS